MQAAIVRQPEWWLDYVASGNSNEPLVFHPNFDLTEAEFLEFLAAAEDQNLAVIEQGIISARPNALGEVELSWFSSAGAVDGYTIDPVTLMLRTPLGEVVSAMPWSAGDTGGFLGAAQGWRWQSEETLVVEDLSTASFSTIELTIAVRESDGRVYFKLLAGSVDAGTPTGGTQVSMLYDRPDAG
jgi:hypothetical protein